MKIALYSDLHLEFSNIFLEPQGAAVVVLAGDIWTKTRGAKWALNTFDCDIVYVLGNHEYYGSNLDTLAAKIKAEAAELSCGRLHVLDRDELVLQEHDVRILGCTLWTDYQLYAHKAGRQQKFAMLAAEQGLRDFGVIKTGPEYRRLTARRILEQHHLDRQWLAGKIAEPFAGKTVVVTHHAPSEQSVPVRFVGDELTPCYASHLEAMTQGVDLWCHGHTHQAVDYQVGACRVICNPRGYESYHGKEQTGFDADLIIEV